MEFKGTEGKWYISGDKYPSIETKEEGKLITHPTIATVTSTFRNYEEYTANAKIIACAPEMWKLLGDIQGALTMQADPNLNALIDEIYQLRLKATE